ncbi:thiamine phosphate synthase [Paenibacillus sp. PK4536]|uniref:thiamine phosphate synthase n=1 Tax=Paenibacillus sp. PK4536 TaxID=3024576 RepID=UPI00235A1363|nr:thiamine phosphate synthase [Paenibacillus sp. PK4536]WIM38542.1 thiamine phosphate synthase [Paenibacillus sp. PK4536]
MELHAISTGQRSIDQLVKIASQIYSWTTAIHIREKKWSDSQIINAVQQLIHTGVPRSKIRINSRPQLAVDLNIGGVHLSEHMSYITTDDPLSRWKVGRSVHSIEQALQAQDEGVDYLFYGHIYATTSKPDLSPRGLDQLEKLCHAVSIPVIAIGGIQPEHCQDIHQAGATGIAVMSGIFEAEHPQHVCQLYNESIQQVTFTDLQSQSLGKK